MAAGTDFHCQFKRGEIGSRIIASKQKAQRILIDSRHFPDTHSNFAG